MAELTVLSVTKHKSVAKEKQIQATSFGPVHPKIALALLKEQSSTHFRLTHKTRIDR